jgi:hypothetical protein
MKRRDDSDEQRAAAWYPSTILAEQLSDSKSQGKQHRHRQTLDQGRIGICDGNAEKQAATVNATLVSMARKCASGSISTPARGRKWAALHAG